MIEDKEKNCAVTGHRVLKSDFNRETLKKVFVKLIEEGKKNFLIGMAVGFDTECFKILNELKKDYSDIKLIACIPCRSQASGFNAAQKREYEKMVSIADLAIYVSEEYDNKCMFKRNMFMVDNASVLVAYLNRKSGGTFNTVNYAARKNIKTIFVN